MATLTKIQDCRIYAYNLPFKSPLQLKSKLLSSKYGFILELTSLDGKKGYGDISPLEGFSFDSLGIIHSKLALLPEIIKNFDQHDLSLYPSLDFAIKSALNMLNMPSITFSLPLNQLLLLHETSALEKLQSCPLHAAVKVKVCHLTPKLAADAVEHLLSVRPDLHLRIDINCAWNLDETLLFCQKTQHLTFEYLEDPTDSLEELVSLSHYTHHVFALDELLQKTQLTPSANLSKKVSKQVYALESLPHIKALILKPTLLGYTTCLSWIHQGKHLGKTITMSSSFESSIGILNCALLAYKQGILHEIAGLNTLSYFKEDLEIEAIHVATHKLHIDLASFNLDTSKLECLYVFENLNKHTLSMSL